MKKTYRPKPYVVLSYEALFRNLKEEYRENRQLNQDFANYLSGFLGEQQVDYKLRIMPLRNLNHIQGLRLKVNHNFFQVDSIILSTRFMLLIEIKNWKGDIIYQPTSDSFTQIYRGNEKRYENPISQIQYHEIQMSQWLQQFAKIYNLPIETLVVLSDSNTNLQGIDSNPNISNKLIYVENILTKIEQLKMKYSKNVLNQRTLEDLQYTLMMSNQPLHLNLIQKYNLNKSHFVEGIPCNHCGHYPLRRTYKSWYCEKCLSKDNKAHVRKILDYFLLTKLTISNKECRDFLQLSNEKTAYTLLNSLDLKKTGKNKGRIYHAPTLEDFPQNSYVPNRKREKIERIVY